MKSWFLAAVMLASCAYPSDPAHAQNREWSLKPGSLDQINRPAPRPVIERFQRPGCTLYEHPDGAGAAWRYRTTEFIATTGYRVDTGKFNLPAASNDKVSSLRCDWTAQARECRITVYRDPNQTGPGRTYLGSEGLVNTRTGGFEDTISSISIECNKSP